LNRSLSKVSSAVASIANACQLIRNPDAKFYFLRGVLHGHPPHQVCRILEQTKAAMGPDSILLIDEMILPETGVSLMAASIDMAMLTALAGSLGTS